MYDRFATERLIDLWLTEDIGCCDLTVQLMIDAQATGRFAMNARQEMVVAGIDVAASVFRRYDPRLSVTVSVKDGDKVGKGTVLATIEGPAQSVLTAERTALNILQRMCGIATETARYVAAIAGTNARLIDTRKTTPGLRALEKYAVRCGGGVNHRMSLSDAALVKDNHVIAAGGVAQAFRAVREEFPDLPIEVEVDTLEQVREVLAAGADLILLDNFTPEQTAEAVKIVAGRAVLESSGRLTLENARAYAVTGVDYLAVGALTHSSPILDIGLDLRPAAAEG